MFTKGIAVGNVDFCRRRSFLAEAIGAEIGAVVNRRLARWGTSVRLAPAADHGHYACAGCAAARGVLRTCRGHASASAPAITTAGGTTKLITNITSKICLIAFTLASS
jgi:hypothetical protein